MNRSEWAARVVEMRAACRALRKQAADRNDQDVPHYLYRCWDADGQLIYIGCSNQPEARIASHLKSPPMNPTSAQVAQLATRWEIESQSRRGRIAGLAAEKAAIQAEAPLLNIHHNKMRGAA